MGSKRAILIVLDGVGAGAAPDAADFGDPHGPSTLLHTWQAAGGIKAPNLAAIGFLSAGQIPDEELGRLGLPLPGTKGQRDEGTPSSHITHHTSQLGGQSKIQNPKSKITSSLGLRPSTFCRLCPLSKGGKDSVTGHWEMMGIVLDKPFPTYPNGFPIPLIKGFEKRIGTQTLGNKPASGTAIIAELGKLHMETGFPIVYTSADSVFQIACHEEIMPVEKLYEWCRIAREICIPPNDIERVIARPFIGTPGNFDRTDRRKDFVLPPPKNLVDKIGDVFGIGVVPELFAHRGFREVRRSQNNAEHAQMLWKALESDAQFIFANFEDTDMRYGHRNDPIGFAKCLEDFDRDVLAPLLKKLSEDDLFILTADHGNDPTDVSTDHTREFVPMCVVNGRKRGFLGDLNGFSHVGGHIAEQLDIAWR